MSATKQAVIYGVDRGYDKSQVRAAKLKAGMQSYYQRQATVQSWWGSHVESVGAWNSNPLYVKGKELWYYRPMRWAKDKSKAAAAGAVKSFAEVDERVAVLRGKRWVVYNDARHVRNTVRAIQRGMSRWNGNGFHEIMVPNPKARPRVIARQAALQLEQAVGLAFRARKPKRRQTLFHLAVQAEDRAQQFCRDFKVTRPKIDPKLDEWFTALRVERKLLGKRDWEDNEVIF